jgi:alpha-galactosidase
LSTKKLKEVDGINPNRRRAFERQGGTISKGILSLEYSDHGTGDFRSPSFVSLDTVNGGAISPLRYRKHVIIEGKIDMPDNLPGLRYLGKNKATTLIVTMGDAGTKLEVDLIYGECSLLYYYNKSL